MELDLLELGERPTRCLKGENAPGGDKVIAGRAWRGKLQKKREAMYEDQRQLQGRWSPWWVKDDPRDVARLGS